MKSGIDYTSNPNANDCKPVIDRIEAAGEDPFNFDYWFSDREFNPVGGYCEKAKDKYVIAMCNL